MPSILFLKIFDLGGPEGKCRAQWRLYDAQGECLKKSADTADLADIAASIPTGNDRKTCVLLEGHDILVSEATVAREHTRHLRSAVAYAVEERLAEPAEDVHVAIGQIIPSADSASDLTYETAVIRDHLMQRLLASLAAAGLAPDIVTADMLLLPPAAETATLLAADGHVLFRLAPAVASNLESGTFLTFFEQYLAQAKASQTDPLATRKQLLARQLDVWAKPPADKTFIDRVQALCKEYGIAVTLHPMPGDALDWLCQQSFTHSVGTEPMNFLQGGYGTKGWMNSLSSQAKKIGLVLALWLIAQLAVDVSMTGYLNGQTEMLKAQSAALYHQLFPQDAKIVDLKAQMEQHLKNTGAGATELTSLLGVLADDSGLAHKLEIEGMHYDAARHELLADVMAGDFMVFEQYKKLSTSAVAVEVGSVVRESKGARGQIRIRGQR